MLPVGYIKVPDWDDNSVQLRRLTVDDLRDVSQPGGWNIPALIAKGIQAWSLKDDINEDTIKTLPLSVKKWLSNKILTIVHLDEPRKERQQSIETDLHAYLSQDDGAGQPDVNLIDIYCREFNCSVGQALRDFDEVPLSIIQDVLYARQYAKDYKEACKEESNPTDNPYNGPLTARVEKEGIRRVKSGKTMFI